MTNDDDDVFTTAGTASSTTSSQNTNEDYGLGYQNTVMYGRYSRQLGEYAKLEALRQAEKRRKKDERARKKELQGYHGKLAKSLSRVSKYTFSKLGEDWVFLAVLGIIMAVISFVMDITVEMCNHARVLLYRDLADNPVVKYLAWVSFSICMILFSAGFAHLVSPQSIGSGIPEMKTILRGIPLKGYLTFRTLVAKVIGLIATLSSGMPLGKEGPFVHIASIVGMLLSKFVTPFQGIYANESRTTEMLAAACAAGIASCFAAPVGGVLFSIEVTSVYFAVRNYWRGFFVCVCGAALYRLLSAWFEKTDTVTPLYRTSFTMDTPFDIQELLVFALIGVVCGLAGALYVWLHKRYVTFIRSNETINGFLQKNRFIYPTIVTLVVTSLSFPLGFGQFSAGELTTHEQIKMLFSNFTWSTGNLTVEQQDVVKHWVTPYTGVCVNLLGFVIFSYIFSFISYTIPVPCGNFVPVFKIGAGFGRLVGELMHMWFSSGTRLIVPGGYAAVGAAAFTAAVTHSISVSVIVFEVTGQITHIIPIMIAVLISNAVASLLFVSIYESIIIIKKLPYLPDFLPSSSGMYGVYVEDFMVREVKYIYYGISYEKLRTVLSLSRSLKSFPLVDNPENMVLLGSVQRKHLVQLIDKHIGRERRLQIAVIRHHEATELMRSGERRPSRFLVSSAPDMLAIKQIAEAHQNPSDQIQPKKSILKKTNSFTIKSSSPLISGSSSGSVSYNSAENRIRMGFGDILRKSGQIHLDDNDDDESSGTESILDDDGIPPRSRPSSSSSFKRVQLPNERICDMSLEDKEGWEREQMKLPVDFTECHIDPAPFQLVERTSLLKVHFLFTMVRVKHAYVTAIGKLVGVVGLTDLRKAIEEANSGSLRPSHRHHIYTRIPTNNNKNDCEVKVIEMENFAKDPGNEPNETEA